MNAIYAVCGFPRSGTTLTMRMLYAAGMPVVADSLISFEADIADLLNRRDRAWWLGCYGKAVKLLEPHRLAMPLDLDFNFVWCQRDPMQQARSQVKLLRNFNGLQFASRAVPAMARNLQADTPLVQSTLQTCWPKAKFMVLFFEQTIAQPRETAKQLCHWAQLEPTEERLARMAGQVLPRGPGCYPGMLEEMLVEPETNL